MPPRHKRARTTGTGCAPPRRRGGLTLVEVTLAMALLGIAAVVLSTAASRCLAVLRSAKNYYNARYVLDLGELEHPILIRKVQDREQVVNLLVGPIEYPNGYTFTRTAERSETLEDLYVVKTRVAWSTRGGEAAEEVVSYLYYTNDLEP